MSLQCIYIEGDTGIYRREKNDAYNASELPTNRYNSASFHELSMVEDSRGLYDASQRKRGKRVAYTYIYIYIYIYARTPKSITRSPDIFLRGGRKIYDSKKPKEKESGGGVESMAGT